MYRHNTLQANLISIQCKRLCFAVCLLLTYVACSSETPQDNQPKKTKKKAAKVSASVASFYQSKGDPLAALYQKSEQSIQQSFDQIKHQKLSAEFPRFVRQALSKMMKIVSLSTMEWELTILNHMKHKKNDIDFTIQWSMLGTSQKIQQALSIWKTYDSNLPGISKANFKKDEAHQGKATPITWHFKRLSTRIDKKSKRQKQTWSMTWNRQYPVPSQNLKEIKSCRFLPGIPVPRADMAWEWMTQRLSTTGDRRFTQWYRRANQKVQEWQILWVYRNGRVRDRDVGRWVKALEAKQAKRTEQSGAQQTWELQKPVIADVSWWVSHELDQLGCQMDRPVLGMSWQTTNKLK